MATDVTIYDDAGTILRCVRVFNDVDAQIQAKAGENWMLGLSDPERDRVDNGQIVSKPAENLAVLDFNAALAAGREEILSLVRRKHLEFITDLPAQVRRYEKKEAEAQSYLSDPAPDMANYPRLFDEIGVTASTATDLANLWVAMADAWEMADRAVEKARMTAKTALATATTVADVDVAISALKTALGAIHPPE